VALFPLLTVTILAFVCWKVNKYLFKFFVADCMRSILTVSVIICCLFFLPASGQEIGLQLNSLRDQFEVDASGTMAKVKAMGIRQVEMAGTHGLSFPEFIKLLAANGITVVSYEADYEKLTSFPQVVADEARSYGAKFIVCSLPSKETPFSKQEIEKNSEAFNHAGKVISRNGMLLCYEPNGNEFASYNNGTLFDYFVEKLDSRYVHFEMDVFLIKNAGQDPVSLLKKYPSRFVLLQLKDGKAPGKDNAIDKDANLVLGSGDVGIKSVIETARDLGIQHYFIEDESSKAEKQIPKSLAYLKTLNSKDSAKK
jgi:sugar phosphate isomerase/epimerase